MINWPAFLWIIAVASYQISSSAPLPLTHSFNTAAKVILTKTLVRMSHSLAQILPVAPIFGMKTKALTMANNILFSHLNASSTLAATVPQAC